MAAGPPQAWLVSVKDSGAHTDADRLLLQQGVTAVAFELLRLRVADTTARRLAGDVLVALARGDLAGSELQRRLEPFGLGGEVGALVLHAGEARAAAERLELALETALHAETASGLVAVHGGPRLRAAARRARRRALRPRRERVLARVVQRDRHRRAARGAPVAPSRQGGRGRRSTRRAAPWRRRMLGRAPGPRTATAARPLTTYRDLGSFALLLSLQDSDALRLFCESMLGPIEADEGHYGGELVRSLEAFIECNGQWEAAARRLFCHRHTLRYRMRKVEELTGRDLSSARDRIEFWLALRGRELVVAAPS